MRRILQALAAILLATLLVFSIPLMNWFIKGDRMHKEPVKTEVQLKKIQEIQQKPKTQQATRKPNRSKPTARSIKGGPRFSMDLSVMGPSGGAGIDASLMRGGGEGGGASGDVDERPEAESSPSLQTPEAIRNAERDATLRLSFCVDASGGAYDIRVLEENPAGLGLAEAGKESLRRIRFKPARKDGMAVAFCGLEQPFEIRFRD